jgi:class IV lanthipeptide synthase
VAEGHHTESGDLVDTTFFPTVLTALAKTARPYEWKTDQWKHNGQYWVRVQHAPTPLPAQGWKLHVSSGLNVAIVVLLRSLNLLFQEGVSFKVAGSSSVLRYLNSGEGGATQIGKFITVYPSCDEQAVRLAVLLDRATKGIEGPRVPSDRPLVPGSLIYYRYGAFLGGRDLQTPVGEIVSAILDDKGQLVPDMRREMYVAPNFVEDPFIAMGAAGNLPEPDPIVGQRYLVLGALYRSHSTTVQLAIDLEAERRCVLKRAHGANVMAAYGLNSTDRLRHEAATLGRLASDRRFARVFDLFVEDDDVVLVQEDLEGETLEQRVSALQRQGRNVSSERVVSWGQELASSLGVVHRMGLVHSDLKPANIIVSPNNSLHVIDFNVAREIGHEPELTEAIERGGTPGYMSPQHMAGNPPAITDDVYGLGCILYYAATGAQPSQTPAPLGGALSRPIAALNPSFPKALGHVIERCLAHDPALRFGSMTEVDGALGAVSVPAATQQLDRASPDCHTPEHQVRHHHRTLARRLAETLRLDACAAPGHGGLAWLSAHASARGFRSRDLCLGSAGAVLALADLAGTFESPELRLALAEGARWLTVAPPPGGDPLPGLYVGESGIGAALLRAGQVLGDDRLLVAAIERGRMIASLPHASPDMYNGTAGRLRFHLLLYEATGETECLHNAIEAGEIIRQRAEPTPDGGLCWSIPAGYGRMSGQSYLGYAHGAAGIADALIDLVEVVGGARYLTSIRGAGRWLKHLAVEVLEDRHGLGWPVRPGAALSVPFWCHGAAGIGEFFRHGAANGMLPGAADVAEGAARSTALAARAAGPSQCHGLAGNIEFLMDMYQYTGISEYLTEARSLGTILEAFTIVRDEGLTCYSEIPGLVTPDYMVGYAGVAVALLRLSDPARQPRQLSRAGFRHNVGTQKSM